LKIIREILAYVKNFSYLCKRNKEEKKMKKKMTNIEMLVWGISHIAENHGFNADTNYEEEGEVCIWGGCNVPTLADVQMLCEDLHIENECVESNECGIDVFIAEEWWDKYANEPYTKGMEFWRRVA
jgi:hypothetical protein